METARNNFRGTCAVGYWLAWLVAVLQGVNAARTMADPNGFASYMGLPVDQLAPLAWVQVFGLRAGFIAILTAILLAREDFAALKSMAVATLVKPLGDAWLASAAAAPVVIIARHIALAIFLLVAWHFLAKTARAQSSKGWV